MQAVLATQRLPFRRPPEREERQRTQGEAGGLSLSFLGWVGLGVGLGYLLEPQGGPQRRAWLRDTARTYWQRIEGGRRSDVPARTPPRTRRRRQQTPRHTSPKMLPSTRRATRRACGCSETDSLTIMTATCSSISRRWAWLHRGGPPPLAPARRARRRGPARGPHASGTPHPDLCHPAPDATAYESAAAAPGDGRDLHWIDPTSHEFLTEVVERLVSVPLLVAAAPTPLMRAGARTTPWRARMRAGMGISDDVRKIALGARPCLAVDARAFRSGTWSVCLPAGPHTRRRRRPVSSNGPETHAKQLALSYAFDLGRVFNSVVKELLLLFVPKAHEMGVFGTLILARVLERILS